MATIRNVDEIYDSEGRLVVLGGLAVTLSQTFDTVADVTSEARLTEGTVIQTLGYDLVGDNGGNLYLVVPAGSGSADFGQYIDIPGLNLQLKGLFPNGKRVEQWGTGNEQRAIWAVQASQSGEVIDFSHKELMLLGSLVHGQGDSGIENITLTADPAFSGVSNGEALLYTQNGLRQTYEHVRLDGAGVANGLWTASGGFWNAYKHVEVFDFKDFGIRLEGGTDQHIEGALVTGQSEVSERTPGGIGIDVANGDVKIANTVIRYADIPLRIAGGTFLGTGNHIYNGSANSADPATNSNAIVLNQGFGGTLCHTYLDKGRIVMDGSTSLGMFDTKLLFNSTPEHDSVVHMIANEDGQSWPTNFTWDGTQSTLPLNSGTMDFVTLADGDHSWSAEAENVAAELNRFGGYPRIVYDERAKLVGPERVHVTPGDTQTVLHSFGTQNSTLNGSVGVQSITKPGNRMYRAAGMTFEVDGTGTASTGTIRATGSRTGFTSCAAIELRNRKGAAGDFNNNTGTVWSLYSNGRLGADPDDLIFSYSNVGETALTEKLRYSNTDSNFRPGSDNTVALGSGSRRWSEVNAGNGTIVTSDARLKEDVEDLTEAELAVGRSLKVRRYKMKDSVEGKGAGARWHFGFIAQEVIQAFEDQGLDAFDYGVVCLTKWDAVEEVRDEDGNIVVPYEPAGERLGVRYDELYALMQAGKAMS